MKVTEGTNASEWCRINDIKTSTFHQWQNNKKVKEYRMELEKNPEAKPPEFQKGRKAGENSTTTREEEDELILDVVRGKVTAAEVSRDSGHSYAKICYWVRRAIKAKGKPNHKRKYNKSMETNVATKKFLKRIHGTEILEEPIEVLANSPIDVLILKKKLEMYELVMKKHGISPETIFANA
jgi:hypothetical protein